MRYLLFGTGDYYERYKKWFEKENIVVLLDNSSEKQNSSIDGIKIVSPAEGIKLDYDVIVILSFYVKSMKAQLIELGVDEKRIYHFFDLHKILNGGKNNRPIKYFGNAESIALGNLDCNKKILLLSHDLTLGGPALALYHAAEVLCDKGYTVVFASMLDGPLRQTLTDREIPVIVDENLQIQTMKEADWTGNFDLVICNTISFYVYLSLRDEEIPIIWWLHDSLFFYDGVDKEILGKISIKNLEIVSVGPIPRSAIKTFLPEIRISDLLYGVVDKVTKFFDSNEVLDGKEKICFTTIGYIENRKGQDVLMAAIKRLRKEILNQCKFFLVGQNSSLMAQQIKLEIENIPQVVMTGTVGRDEINNILSKTDMLICPSREDPMPTVAAEAMMHRVPCLISNAAGTSEYINEGISGLIFNNEDVRELAEKIAWCVEHRNDIIRMGKEARKVYENVFSVEAFERNFMQLVERVF